MNRILVLALAATLCAAPAARAGDVEGKIVLPEKKKSRKSDGAYPGGGGDRGPRTQGPAAVFLEPLSGAAPAKPPAENPKMEQEGREFEPLLLPVVVGTTVDFPNRDEEYHNVFSRSETKQVELGRYGKGESKSVTFDKPGIVRLRCEVHSSMHAVILVLTTPYFAVSDEQGNYSVQGVPAGKYRVYAFHEDAKPKDKDSDPLRSFAKDVEIGASGSVRADFDLRAGE